MVNCRILNFCSLSYFANLLFNFIEFFSQDFFPNFIFGHLFLSIFQKRKINVGKTKCCDHKKN